MRFLAVLLLLPQDAPGLKPGLLGEYYSIGEEIDDFPALKNRKPAARKIDGTIDFKDTAEGFNGTDLRDYFCVRWTGVIRIPEDGEYLFLLNSDDGSRLKVDGRLAVDNGGLHGMGERAGAPMTLKKGDLPLQLDFFENERGAGCHLLWKPPGGEKAVVPAAALFHAADARLDK